jgi:aminoglycoside phosphotransferase (APT) family kinase protein
MLTPDQLDGPWFESVLAARHPGVRVRTAHVTRVDEWTNCHVRVELSYDHPGDGAGPAPARVFVKLPPRDARKAKALGSARMGAREARFYTELAPALDLRVPTPHGAVIEDDGGFAIVLEDLADSGCRPFNARPVAPDATAVALEDLARMHVRYEEPARRTSADVAWVEAPRLPPPGATDAPNIGQILLRKGIDEQRDRLGEPYVAVAERWIAHRADLQALWWDAPLTVIHNDCHPGNLFDDHGRVGFFDWGLMCLGDPLRDASYFLCLALDTDARREHERALLESYLEARRALGGRAIAFDDAWLRHRIHAAYTVPASCQALDVPADSTASAREFSDVFLARAIAAVEDLDSIGAIETAADG